MKELVYLIIVFFVCTLALYWSARFIDKNSSLTIKMAALIVFLSDVVVGAIFGLLLGSTIGWIASIIAMLYLLYRYSNINDMFPTGVLVLAIAKIIKFLIGIIVVPLFS